VPCQAPYQAGTDIQGGGSGAAVGIDSLQSGLWVPAGAPYVSQLNLTVVATRSYLTRFVCPRAMTISKIGFALSVSATANDSCDAGIYSADGTVLLGSAGATAGKLNVGIGVQVLNLQAPISLAPNTVYYAAFAQGAIGGTAAQVIAASGGGGTVFAFGTGLGVCEQLYLSAFPLPGSAAGALPVTPAPILGLQT
jgi:hypothetical protein